MSVIDPEQHADLIEAQRRSTAAFAALDAYAASVGKPGIEWSAEEHARGEELREAARAAAAAKDAALYASGLPHEHGYYRAAQDLKNAARAEPPD
ncbi:hypothetical protein H3146_04020 [Streptomyces sp. OF3]|uniref:Uncharacterized protein n=1 Tax=Streptomyces alkaliterrae TaxID=2213162 RepID=A0A7W3WHM6_9ACTN|nr:hypothetical protein [Streptomyces alkaliterrae]MBB1252542.1 hypothetical protein [Streptomyces alkaliterrae]